MSNFFSKFRTFFTDEDGLNPKDFLLLVGAGVLIITFVASMTFVVTTKAIPPDLFKLMDRLDGVLMTIFGGTMGVQAAESAGKYLVKREEIKSNVHHTDGYDSPQPTPIKENKVEEYDPI